MKPEVNIIKRLEMLKTSLELGDEDVVELQMKKIEGIDELSVILELCKQPCKDIDKIIKAINDYLYKPRGNTLTPHQEKIFNDVCNEFETILSTPQSEFSSQNNFVSLSGFAGVGKTFVTSKLIEYFIKKKDYKILLTTPTHKSLAVAKYMINNNNLKVPTSTLQAYLDIKLFTDYFKGTKVFKRDKLDLQADFEKNLDILIVDESSMVSNELLKFIEENLLQNKLKSVLFIGDPYQLPPVDEGQNGVENLPKCHHLVEIVRQSKDSYIKMIAIELKECIRTKKYTPLMDIIDTKKYENLVIFYDLYDLYEDFSNCEKWYDKNTIMVSYTNDNVDKFNRVLRAKYWLEQDITPEEAIINGEILVFNDAYKREFMSSETVKIKHAEKKENNSIMLVEENGEQVALQYFVCICEDGRSFKTVEPDHYKLFNSYLKSLGEKASKEKDKAIRKDLWRKYFTIKEEYADLKYKYSTTIHKSQGSTYETVYIDLKPIINLIKRDIELAYKLLYVAVTRASKDAKFLL